MSYDRSVELLEIDTQWDAYNSNLLIGKLNRHVEMGDFDFEFKASRGSVLGEIAIGYAAGLGASLTVELVGYLWKRMRVEKNRNNDLRPPTVHIRVEGDENQITIESEKDVEEIEEWLNSQDSQ